MYLLKVKLMRKNNKKIISFLMICFLTLGIFNFGNQSSRVLELKENFLQPKTADTSLKIAILDSTATPTYAIGVDSNDFASMHNGLISNGFDAIIITNADIVAGILETVDVLVLIDNWPSDAASGIVKDWALKGGGIFSFDSSIALLNWAGIIPPEADGANGVLTYWNYLSPDEGIVINDGHPVMNGYNYGDNVSGKTGNSQYFSDAIMTTSAGPYYTPLVKDNLGSNFDLVVALDAPYCGRVVHIWDQLHWDTTSNQQMILNGINWIRDKFADLPEDVGINEINTGFSDYIELYNNGPSIDMTGWYIEMYDSNTLAANYTFPNGWMFNSHQIVVLHELTGTDTSTDLYAVVNIVFHDRPIAVGLFDDNGANIDWFETINHTLDIPSDAVWINDTDIYINQNIASRINNIDTDRASDWKISASSSEGFLNPGQIPFEFKTITGPVAIFRDEYPWHYNATDIVLDMYGISYTVYNSSDMGSVDISPYEKVIIDSDQTQTFYDSLGLNISWFESYAAGGGILEIHACDRAYNGGRWDGLFSMPGGLNQTPSLINDVDINLSQHPIILNPHTINDTAVDNWSYSAHGYFNAFPVDSREILQDTATSNPILLEFPFGNGHIIASMQTLEHAYCTGEPGSEVFENIILYDPSDAFTDTLTVETPNSLSSWHTDTSHDIEWVTTGNVSNVKIELYRAGVFELEITANITNDGEFSWSIPLSPVDSTQYQIKVTDVSNPSTYDYSQFFEIYNPTITVTSPDSASSWLRGTDNSITWTSTGTLTNVKIELFLNDIFVLEIIANTPNDGDYNWTLPSDLGASTLYQIKITDSSNALIYDFSDYFEVPSSGGTPGIPGYNLLILIASLVGVSILLLKKKLKTK